MDTTHTLAIGWVHNLNAYWENHYYVKSDLQNFFGCTAPSSQQVALSGFATGADYHITWFPTRINDTIHPADAVDQTGTGTVLLDMATAQLSDTANKYLDTLHLDYGFIISLAPVYRSMAFPMETDTTPYAGWDFGLYPNPAHDLLNLVLPDNAAKDITIYDLTGKRVYYRSNVAVSSLDITTGGFGRGAYCIRVSDATSSKMKNLILR